MKHDMITLFNRLTTRELADYTLFSHMLDLHYEKFKYLYYMLKDVDLAQIDNIICEENSERISVNITPTDIDYCSDIMASIDIRKDSYKKCNYFDTSITCYSNDINIIIRMAGDEKEGDLYADRLI